jgi:SNF2 family DNA or RNA helicase
MAALYQFQERGKRYLASRERAILGDSMGLGKSPQAIAALDEVGAQSVLIITPASVRLHWQRELERWSRTPRRVQVVTTASEPIDPRAEVIIVSPALAVAPATLEQLMARRYDALIADEAQMFKAASAKRTQILYGRHCDGVGGLVERADRIWLLSGTIAPNSVAELWPHLRAFGLTWMTFEGFQHRFCALRETKWGFVPIANKNTAELRELIRPVFLRRRPEDVLSDFPSVRAVTTPIEADAGALLEDDPALRPLRDALESGDEATILAAISRVSGDAVAALRRRTGLAKLPGAVALCAEELESDPTHKLVIFAHHRAVVRGLAEGLAEFGAVVLEGATPPAARQAAIDRFASDPQCRAFVANLIAGGTGISLVAAAHVVVVEPSWVPSENSQAIARCRRIGQQRGSVLARFLAIPDSLDEGIAGVLARKAAMLAELEGVAA